MINLEKLSMNMAKISEQRHLRAIRDGIVSTLPLIIIGSIFLIIAIPPFPKDWAISILAKKHAAQILLPFRMTMFIMGLYAVIGIGYSLAKSYKLDGITGAILSVCAFLLTLVPKVINPIETITQTVGGKAVQVVVAEGTKGSQFLQEDLGYVMQMSNLGSAGLFVGIIVAIFAVEVYRFTTKTGFRIKMPDAVPESVARSFEALTPAAIIIFTLTIITYWLKIDLHHIVGLIVTPFLKLSDSWFSVVVIVFLITFFWSFGIHGDSIIGSVVRPLWLMLLEQNATALANGKAIPHIAAEPLYQWFIWIGGSGTTIGLALLMLFKAKSSYGKALGKAVILPAIFNINEPIIFGAPIMLNPTLLPPFIIVPIVNASITYFAMSVHWVNRVTSTPPWTLPSPIGAFLATNGDFRAVILNIILIVISIVIYYPFFTAYEKKLLVEEKAEKTGEE